MFGTSVLELPVSELFPIIFTRFLFESSFRNHKEIHENGLKGVQINQKMYKGQHMATFDFDWSKFDL